MALLQITDEYLNDYERAHEILKRKFGFEQEGWERAAREGNLDFYMGVISKTDELNQDDFKRKYKFDFLNTEQQRTTALANELFADRETLNTYKRAKLNAYGEYVKDASGQIVYEDYQDSEYNYVKDLLLEQANINYEKFLRERAEEEKNNLSTWHKIWTGGASLLGEFVLGATEMVDSIGRFMNAGFKAVTNEIMKGIDPEYAENKSFIDVFTEENADDWGLFKDIVIPGTSEGLLDWIKDFEGRNSFMRDLDGNYTNVGQYIGGILYSLGQMFPASIAGSIAGAAGAGGKLVEATSSGTFYVGLMSDNVKEMYDKFEQQGVSVSNGQIIANAATKAALQWAIEKGLSALLGGSAFDKLVFGRAVKVDGKLAGKLTSKLAGKPGATMATKGILRLAHDFVEEGFEEVFQDTSDFLVDRIFSVWNENFGEVTDISFRTLLDSFIIGGLTSLVGSIPGIIRTKRVTVGIKTDENGNIKTTKKGDVKYRKLGKLGSWEYGFDIQAFGKAFNDVIDYGYSLHEKAGIRVDRKTGFVDINDKNRENVNQKDLEKFQGAFEELYAAARVVSSVYGAIGEERAAKANEILKEVSKRMEEMRSSSSDIDYYNEQAYGIYNEIGELTSGVDVAKELINKIKEAKLAEIEATVTREDESIKLDEKTSKELDKVFKERSKLDKVVVTKHGEKPVIVEDEKGRQYAVIPKRMLKFLGVNEVQKALQEQELVKTICSYKFKGNVLGTIHKLFRETIMKTGTIENAVTTLLFDESFFKVVLSSANKDMVEFLSSLSDIVASIEVKDANDARYKNNIQKTLKNMLANLIEYATYNSNVPLEIFTRFENGNEIIRRIQNARYANNVLFKILDNPGELTAEDKTFLRNKVNYLQMTSETKDTVYNNLFSDDDTVRKNAVITIKNYYYNTFHSKYDGKTYLTDTSIENRIFNYRYLQILGLTIDTLFDEELLTESDKEKIFNTINTTLDKSSITEYRQQQFKQMNPGFEFLIRNNQIIVKNTAVKIQYTSDFEKYAGLNVLWNRYALDNPDYKFDMLKPISYRSEKDIINHLLNEDVNPVDRATLTINDIIYNVDLLTPEIRTEFYNTIKNDENYEAYKNDVRHVYAFLSMYLKRVFGKNIGIGITTNENYVLINLEYQNNLLKHDYKTTYELIKKEAPISEIIKDEYLYSSLKDVHIELSEEGPFFSAPDYIVLPVNYFLKPGIDYEEGDEGFSEIDEKTKRYVDLDEQVNHQLAIDSFLHEFTHAMQFANRFSNGFDQTFLFNFPDSIQKKIIEDFETHIPGLKKDDSKQNKLYRIANLIYDFNYGETTADSRPYMTFYPFVTIDYRDDGGINGFKTPWGTEYILSKGISFKAFREMNYGFKHDIPILHPVESFIKAQTDEITFHEYIQNPKSAIILQDGSIRTLKENKNFTDFYQTILSSFNTHNSRASAEKFLLKLPTIDIRSTNNINVLLSFTDNITENEESTIVKFIDIAYKVNQQFALFNYTYQTVLFSKNYTNAEQILKAFNTQSFNESIKRIDVTIPIPSIETETDVISDNVIPTKPIEITREDKIKELRDIAVKEIHKRLGKDETYRNANKETRSKILNTELARLDKTLNNLTDKELNERYAKLEKKRQIVKTIKEAVENTTEEKPKNKRTPREYKRTYISKRKSQDTNLKYVKNRRQMSTRLKNFYVMSTGMKLPEALEAGIKAGSTDERFIIDYFRETEKIPPEIFELINKTIFQNNYITTEKELYEHILVKGPSYYALYATLKSAGYDLAGLTDTGIETYEVLMRIVNSDEKLKSFYEKKLLSYNTYNKVELPMSTKNLKRLWMATFDGSITAGYRIALVAREGAIRNIVRPGSWQITGEQETKTKLASLEETAGTTKTGKGEGIALAEVIEDKSAKQAFEDFTSSISNDEKIDTIMQVVTNKYKQKLLESEALSKYTDNEKYAILKKKLMQEKAKYSELTGDELNQLFIKALKLLPDNPLNNMYESTIYSEVANREMQVEDVNAKGNSRTPQQIHENMKHIANTIRNHLTTKGQRERFYNDNGDIFDKKLNLKESVYRKKVYRNDDQGNQIDTKRYTYEDMNKMLELEKRLKDLSKDVRKNVYKTNSSLKLKKKYQQEIKKVETAIKQAASEKGKKNTKGFEYQLSGGAITIYGPKLPPAKYRELLETTYTRTSKTQVQLLSEEGSRHIKVTYAQFVEENAQLLSSITQDEADEMIDFFLNCDIVNPEYKTVQLLIGGYFLGINNLAQFKLSEDVKTQIEKKMEAMISTSASELAIWGKVKNEIKKARNDGIMIVAMARLYDIKFSPESVSNVERALIRHNNQSDEDYRKQIEQAVKAMYEEGIAQWKGSKQSIFDRLLRFERMMMLSGPGTWARNQVSDLIATGMNKLGEKVGSSTLKLLNKLFPKNGKFAHRESQYVITGTKVPDTVQAFIKRELLDNGLFDIINEALPRQDYRQDDISAASNLRSLIRKGIRSQIFVEHSSNTAMDRIYKWLYKMLSDNRYIKKATLKYFGKILVEDNVDISQGLTNEVQAHLADAYVMASRDYMRGANVWSKVDALVREHFGNAGYFAWKQIMPFAASSWNWFLEGLKYNPISLVKSIINYAKLERTIEKYENLKQKGQQTIPPKFAEYTIKRNIGKGVIGTIGILIGALLKIFGVAKLDEEDDKFKLDVFGVQVDISQLLASQGIMLGIQCADLFTNIGTAKSANEFFNNLYSNFGSVLSNMFEDSTFADFYNLFRYSDSFGDFLTYLPFKVAGMFIPNLLKVAINITSKKSVAYPTGIVGRLAKLATSVIPGLTYAFPSYIDPYTGETLSTYKWPEFIVKFINSMSPIDIYPYKVTDIEKLMISQGKNKKPLTGKYEINGEDVKLSITNIEKLNKWYGAKNEQDIAKLMSNRDTYKLLDVKTGKYKYIRYSQMTDSEKATVINRIMNDNSGYAKIYILTETGKYRYYASSDEEYKLLRELGFKNIYKKTAKYEGFVKIS